MLEACARQAGAELSYPFGEQPAVYKVAGKIFAIVGLERTPPQLTLKCDPEHGELLRARARRDHPGLPHEQAPLDHGDARRQPRADDDRGADRGLVRPRRAASSADEASPACCARGRARAGPPAAGARRPARAPRPPRARGAASGRRRCRRRSSRRRCRRARRSGCRRSAARPGRRPPRARCSAGGAYQAPSWCLTGTRRTSPGSRPASQGEPARCTTRSTSRQTKRPWWLGRRTPGSSPASHSTWKPLQMPSTGPPAAAKASTSRIIGREAGDRAGAQVVAVGEAARDDHAGAAVEIGVGVPERDGLAAEQLDGAQRVAVVAASRGT